MADDMRSLAELSATGTNVSKKCAAVTLSVFVQGCC